MKAPEKALEQHANTDPSFIIHDNEKSIIHESVQRRTKARIFDQVKNGTDIILVTSAKHSTDPISLENFFSDSSEEIRTICLSSHSFDTESSDQFDQLSMISAVVYESIHLDSHFAIIVDNADQIAIPTLNELIKLALGINTSKNNVNFVFSGGPNLLGVIEQLSDITRLSLSHCSMDEITEEDIQEFIDLKQNNFDDSIKLQCNKYALKKICTLSNGSLQSASVILEWIRLYTLHISKFKVTVSLIDNLLEILKNTNLLSNYPPHDYQFSCDSSSLSPEDSQNIEFVKPEDLLDDRPLESAEINTIYIEDDNDEVEKTKDSSNIYEKVMNESEQTDDEVIVEHISTDDIESKDDEQEPDHTEEPLIDKKLDDEQLQVEIEAVAVPIKTHGVSKQANISYDDVEYNDTYHLDTLKQINDPLSHADEDLPLGGGRTNAPASDIETKKSPSNKFFILTTLLILITTISIFAWKYELVDLPNSIKSIIPANATSVKQPTTIEKNQTIATSVDQPAETTNIEFIKSKDDNGVAMLIALANQQIDDKKLTTPDGDNAYETFQSVLALEPRNKAALAGIEKIINRYTAWAKLDIKDNNVKRARYFLSLAIEIKPNDRELKKLLSSLDTLKTSSLN